ncbi:MAG: ABC transporter ATP-binding protein [Candidatus Hydrogenedentota bacterium]
MIQAQELTKRYGSITALDKVSFEVAQGEIVGFLGPNGAGKTTAMRILTGYSPATGGTARIAGYDVAKDPIEVKRRVGYLPESVPLYGEMVVRHFLRYVSEIKGVPRHGLQAEAERVMSLCGLQQMGGRIIRNLSKGYRQRVGLAQSLIGNPPVLILDEPTVGLDPSQIIEIRQMIRELAHNHTVLLSTHILPEVSMLCQRVLIIHEGRLVAQDTMENLMGPEDGVVRLEVDTRGPREKVESLLSELEGVQRVALDGAGPSFVVEAAAGSDIQPRIAQAVVQAGYRLCGLRERARTLEDIFVEAISADEGAPV